MGKQDATDMAVFGVVMKILFVQLRLSRINRVKCLKLFTVSTNTAAAVFGIAVLEHCSCHHQG
jgi:hypothetical protein